jgi:hypothetical protein
MDNKRNRDYDRCYNIKRVRTAEDKESDKERMRLYRARKKAEAISAKNDTKFTTPALKTTSIITTNICMDSQNDHQYEVHQTPTVSIPQTSNINNEQITSNNLTYIKKKKNVTRYYQMTVAIVGTLTVINRNKIKRR